MQVSAPALTERRNIVMKYCRLSGKRQRKNSPEPLSFMPVPAVFCNMPHMCRTSEACFPRKLKIWNAMLIFCPHIHAADSAGLVFAVSSLSALYRQPFCRSSGKYHGFLSAVWQIKPYKTVHVCGNKACPGYVCDK